MAAPAQSITDRTIRVYCPTHKVGFDASANRTILCSSQKHTIAETFPSEAFWEYCCDCQHCWIVDLSKTAVATEECLACERAIVRRFVCASCNVASIESDSPARRKAFSMSAQGTPNPTCPGCLKKPAAGVLEHECKDFGVSFLTTFSTCPFCDETLEAPPTFPCAVSQYMEKRRSPATTLTFDPKSSILSETTSGDYVLIEKVRGASGSIVIPKASRLLSKRDYYDTYYELFNCDNPSAGDVIVVSPAVVEQCESGWQVKEPGVIQINSDEPQPGAVAPSTTTCLNCGTVSTPHEQFCGRCGLTLTLKARTQPISSDAGWDKTEINPKSSQTTSPYSTSFAHMEQTAAEVGAGATTASFDNLDSAYVASTPVATSATTTKSMVPKFVLASVVAVFVLVIIMAIALSSGGNSVEKQLSAAITNRNLFPPAAQNAHDLYNQLRNSGASDDQLRAYRERLLPLLTSGPYQLLNELVQIGSDEPTPDQWRDAARNLNWAVELNPQDNKIAAKSAYCEGRAEYVLNKQSEAALQPWQRSANLDKSWSLPVNGIGLIYQSRSDHSTSKSYFLRAMNLDPNWPHPYENLGNDYLEAKDYATAKEYYQKALAKAPDWAKPHLHLALIAVQFNDYETAVKEYEAALDSNAKGMKGKETELAQKGLDRARQKLSQTTSAGNF
jgi:tetratricopeptide (TPR) repeat protein